MIDFYKSGKPIKPMKDIYENYLLGSESTNSGISYKAVTSSLKMIESCEKLVLKAAEFECDDGKGKKE